MLKVLNTGNVTKTPITVATTVSLESGLQIYYLGILN